MLFSVGAGDAGASELVVVVVVVVEVDGAFSPPPQATNAVDTAPRSRRPAALRR
jgi:hypothetical protein